MTLLAGICVSGMVRRIPFQLVLAAVVVEMFVVQMFFCPVLNVS